MLYLAHAIGFIQAENDYRFTQSRRDFRRRTERSAQPHRSAPRRVRGAARPATDAATWNVRSV